MSGQAMSELSMEELIDVAVWRAVTGHHALRDKQGRPAILHVLRVAMQQKNDRALVLGLLHDVVEDTSRHVDDFPRDIRRGVGALTRREGETYGAYIKRVLASGDADVIAVKIADLRDNIARGIGDPRFASLVDRYEAALQRFSAHEARSDPQVQEERGSE